MDRGYVADRFVSIASAGEMMSVVTLDVIVLKILPGSRRPRWTWISEF